MMKSYPEISSAPQYDPDQPIIFVFINGASAVGKSTLADLLNKKMIEINISSQILSMDDYYPRGDQTLQEFVKTTNFYVPEELLWAEIIRNIDSLNQGKSDNKPCYPYKEEYLEKTATLEPTNVVIIEGIFAAYLVKKIPFSIEKLLINLTTDSYYGIITQRKQRDNKERNQDEKTTVLREKQSVGPSFFKFTVMGGARADMHVTHNFDNKDEPFGDVIAEIKGLVMIKLESFSAKKTLDKN